MVYWYCNEGGDKMKEKVTDLLEVMVVILVLVGVFYGLKVTKESGMDACRKAGYSEKFCRKDIQ